MLKQSEIDNLNKYVVGIFTRIELELMKEVANRLLTYDDMAGTLEHYTKKLEELGALNKDAIKIIAKYSGLTEKAVKNMLERASVANLPQPDSEKIPTLIEKIVDNSYVELHKTIKLIQTKAIESAKQEYMNIANTAYLETSSGIYSYNEAIRRGIRKMAENGLKGATYMRKDGTFVQYSIESVVRRDTLTAVNQLANRVSIENADKLGYEYMEVSSHMGARHDETNPINDHVHWQGKVYKLNGFDKDHDNFYTATGYGELLGLAGVNCRHRAYPYRIGDARASEHLDEMKSNEQYDKEQKQRAMEREIRKLKKRLEIAKATGDTDEVKRLKELLSNRYDAINKYCKENGLKRDFNREMIPSETLK